MPNQPGTSGLSYLKKLKPHADLISWINSYDEFGVWQLDLCRLIQTAPLAKKKTAATNSLTDNSTKHPSITSTSHDGPPPKQRKSIRLIKADRTKKVIKDYN